MLEQSAEWQNIFHSDELLPESNVIIKSDINTINTQAMSVVSSGRVYFSNVDNFGKQDFEPGKEEQKLATLELNLWILDGSFNTVIGNAERDKENRFVSNNLCDENCDFQDFPYIGLNHSTPFPGTGFMTVKFAPFLEESASGVQIETNNVLGEFSIDSTNQYIPLKKEEFFMPTNSVVLYIKSWRLPFRRARVSELVLGLRLYFDKTIISRFGHDRTIDMVSAKLPQNDLDFSIIDVECDYDIENPNAKYADSLSANSKFEIYYGYKLSDGWEYKWIDTLYLANLSRPQNGIEASFTLESDIQRMTQVFPNTTSYTWTSFSNLFANIESLSGVAIIDKDIGNYAKIVKSKMNFAHRTLFQDYYTYPMKEWLQTTAATVNVIIFRNVSGSITLKCLVDSNGAILNKTAVDSLSLISCFGYPEIENLNQIKKITLTILRTATESSSEEQGGVLPTPYVYSKTFNSLGIEQTAKNERIYLTKSTSYGFDPDNANEQVHITYMNWLYNFISGAKKIKVNCIINPAWQVGDILEVELKDGSIVKGYLTEIDINYSGYTKGDIVLLAPQSLNE